MTKTDILICLDRSGSMASIKKDIEGSFKEYIEKQKQLPGECRVTLSQFDTVYELVYENRLIQDISSITVDPRGGTALIDSLVKLIDDSGKRYNDMKPEDHPNSVVVLVLSDGETNSDKEFTKEQLKSRIELQQNSYSWQFIFIGCNFDSISAGNSYGINAGSSLNFANTSGGIAAAFCAVDNATTYYRSASFMKSGAAYVFSNEERAAAEDKK